MQKITKSAYARSIGVTPQYINEQLNLNPGCIDLVNGGKKMKVDPTGPNSLDFYNEHYNPEKAKELPPPKPPKVKPAKPKPKKIKQQHPPDIRYHDLSLIPKEKQIKPPLPASDPPPMVNNPGGANGNQNFKDKQDLEKDRIRETIEKLRIGNEKTRGELIPKDLIINVFSQLYAIDENQIKNLDVNLAPKISTMNNEANSQKTTKILKLLGKEKNKELKKQINQILSSGEPERKKRLTEICEDATSKILKNIQREFDSALENIEKIKE